MLAHFMLFSEADIEYRFLMATSMLIEEEASNPLVDSKDNNLKSATSRFHKISLGLVSAKNRKNKNNKL
jgi:hypothetical protein